MKIKHIYILAALILITCIYFLYHWLSKEYTIIDFFADSTGNRKIVFYFVAVNNYKNHDLIKYAKDIFNEHDEMKSGNDSTLYVMVVHFYISSDVQKIPDSIKSSIVRKYPNIYKIENKVDYVPEGFIYTGFSRKVAGVKILQDSLFRSPFIIPKPGVKARDVLRKN